MNSVAVRFWLDFQPQNDPGLKVKNAPMSTKVDEPLRQTAPWVLSSPHSGRNYPPEFLRKSKLDATAVRRSEDYLVDELIGAAIGHGTPIISASFPRAFVDVNREPYELDPTMFNGTLPAFVNIRSPRAAGGLGTIPRIVSETDEIYGSQLSASEAVERIEGHYKPFHQALRNLLARTYVRFGVAVLLDCHSMPSNGPQETNEGRPDFVIGDRFGTSCAPDIANAAREILSRMGYRVTRNKPYAGGFITEHYGRPGNRLHALQLEINRGLYMDEARIRRHSGFARLRDDLGRFIGELVQLPLNRADRQSVAAE